MGRETTQQVVEFLKTFLQASNIGGEIEVIPINEDKTRLRIVTEEAQGYLIGKQGATLFALQHIVSVLQKHANETTQYRVDINNYQEEHDQLFLRRVADYVSEKSESTELLLWPMTAYERRIVHEHFLAIGTHTTESENLGSNRVVRVIKK